MKATYSPNETATLNQLGVLKEALALTNYLRIDEVKRKVNDLLYMIPEESEYWEKDLQFYLSYSNQVEAGQF